MSFKYCPSMPQLLAILLISSAVLLPNDARAERPEIELGDYIAGGVLGTAVGFGIGHAVQGRWQDKGWIFTVGEAAGITLFAVGVAGLASSVQTGSFDGPSSSSYALVAISMLAISGVRIWEIIDVWTAVRPQRRQRHVAAPSAGFALIPIPTNGGGVLSMSLSF